MAVGTVVRRFASWLSVVSPLVYRIHSSNMESLCKLDRTELESHASPGLVDLLEGALERVLDHQVITAALATPAESTAAPVEEEPEPAPEPAKGAGKTGTGKDAGKATKPAAKGKQATPAPPSVESAPEPPPPPPPPPEVDEYSERIQQIRSQVRFTSGLAILGTAVHMIAMGYITVTLAYMAGIATAGDVSHGSCCSVNRR